jgi:hypothetical protein
VDSASTSPLASEAKTTGISTQHAITAIAAPIPARDSGLAVDSPVISSATNAPSSPSHPTDIATWTVSKAARALRDSRGMVKIVAVMAVKAAPQLPEDDLRV